MHAVQQPLAWSALDEVMGVAFVAARMCGLPERGLEGVPPARVKRLPSEFSPGPRICCPP
jgi:hypothetical protein